eukprot:2687618-Pleurochrysis_carterae.AAC.1
MYDENNCMAVNTIDAVFPPNSNYSLHTWKRRPLLHSEQECSNARIVQSAIILARGCEAV